ncbi:hypothetical protein BTVI_60141 [Pitangus sulphuratus]|nr:hypothetical protein BTVI_60141 [Pitangus sulphuratus]
MESSLGDEAWGPTPDRLQESNISDFVEDTLSLRPKDELETIPVEEVQDLKPEDLQESAPAEATQDTKPGTGKVAQRGYEASILADISNSFGYGPEQPVLAEPALTRMLDPMMSSSALLQPFCDSVDKLK